MIQKFSHELEELKVFVVWSLFSLADGVFLVVWACAQQLVDKVVSNLQLSGVDLWLLIAIQLLFAIATFVPIFAHICVSTTRSFVQARIAIEKELRGLAEISDESTLVQKPASG